MKPHRIMALTVGLYLLSGCSTDAEFSETNSTPATQTQSKPQAPQRPANNGHQGAVTKGSFTAWTIPADPAPAQDYQIFIQVKLPPGQKVYDGRDLSGDVRGTDGYKQNIGGSRGSVPADNAVFAVSVPGAVKKVRDLVHVRSGLLKEEQTLTLEF